MNQNDLELVKAFTLRIDIKLFEQVKTLSKQNKRSIGKEIEYAIEQYIKNN